MNRGPDTAAGASHAGAPAGGELVELLHRSARGDCDAFAALYDRTAARVHGLAVRVVRDPAQAEEVTQEVYLEAWRTASRYDDARGAVITWLLTVTHRRAVDRVRSSEASRRREGVFQHRTNGIAHDATAETVQARFEARRVRAALAQLTEVQREAIELAYFGGHTHSEVAALLDLPVGTAKTRIRDGLIRLRDTIGAGR